MLETNVFKQGVETMNQSTTPQGNQQSVVVLILTPIEAEQTFFALGKLPAEATEQLRGKIREQVNGQRELILSFSRQPAVQALLGEIAATPDAIDDGTVEDGTMDNSTETVN